MHNACHVFELNFEVYNSGPHISCQQLPSRALGLQHSIVKWLLLDKKYSKVPNRTKSYK